MEVKQGEAGEKSPAQRIKFKIEWALLMLGVGRTDEAARVAIRLNPTRPDPDPNPNPARKYRLRFHGGSC